MSLDDVCAAVGLVLRAPNDSLADVYNLGSGRSMRVRDMAELVRREYHTMYGRDVPIDSAPGPSEAPAVELSIERLAALGYRPRIDLAEDVRQMLRYCERFAEGQG